MKMSFKFNSSDVLEWEENEPVDPSTLLDHNMTGTETIEKVLKHRAGYPGATGSGTTCYNVEDKGDPNVRPTGEQFEYYATSLYYATLSTMPLLLGLMTGGIVHRFESINIDGS